MTPARRAEIRAYINRLDLDQLPPWTVEQAIIRDLFEALPEVWEEGRGAGYRQCADEEARANYGFGTRPTERPANPYRADAS